MTVETHSASLHLVDPEIRAALDAFPTFDLNEDLLPVMRAQGFGVDVPPPQGPAAGVAVERITVPGRDGGPDVSCLLYTPPGRTGQSGAYLHIHGGGYVLGDAAMSELSNRSLAAALGCILLSVDYRLAPETRWPGAVEDCYAALGWLHANANRLGVDHQRIAIGGESAGGGHAASLALVARDRGEYRIRHQHLIYPMIDDRTGSTVPALPYAGDFVWTAASNAFGWSALLGHPAGTGEPPRNAVPARVEDLSGLPPTFLGTAALDLFVGENLDYGRRLIAAGVPTELVVAPGAYHGFNGFAPDAAVSRGFNSASLEALRRAIG
ncbi:alpha/beta hydrolase [Sphingomonas fennica]|uniref:Arylesterase n=1 Tax=Edaphosphingomonas fennica TaxID=114404 RepID=A0A2T4I4J9_9SPHN|nr:alpha/beta hydrolase [Sphingomonas fennica]PTD24454.1 arylesterase [Sphingomonas fennica]